MYFELHADTDLNVNIIYVLRIKSNPFFNPSAISIIGMLHVDVQPVLKFIPG